MIFKDGHACSSDILPPREADFCQFVGHGVGSSPVFHKKLNLSESLEVDQISIVSTAIFCWTVENCPWGSFPISAMTSKSAVGLSLDCVKLLRTEVGCGEGISDTGNVDVVVHDTGVVSINRAGINHGGEFGTVCF